MEAPETIFLGFEYCSDTGQASDFVHPYSVVPTLGRRQRGKTRTGVISKGVWRMMSNPKLSSVRQLADTTHLEHDV